MAKAQNRFAGDCTLDQSASCTGRVEAWKGVYLRGTIICRKCVARVLRDVHQDGPCARRDYMGVPTGLIRWAARENRINRERM